MTKKVEFKKQDLAPFESCDNSAEYTRKSLAGRPFLTLLIFHNGRVYRHFFFA